MGEEDVPESLSAVPVAQHVRATFGWFPAVFAGGILILATHSAINWPPTLSNYIGSVVLFVAALALLAWEVTRRLRRTVLVRRGARVGRYRAGTLVATFHRNDLGETALHHGNTFKYVFIPFCWTIAGTYLALTPMERAVTAGERAAWLASGLLCAAAVASLVYTRVFCRHFHVPGRRKSPDLVFFTRRDAQRL
jgi:hypothetical protein